MTNTYARTLASCSFTLFVLAGMGCGSDDGAAPAPQSGASAGSAATAPTNTATPSDTASTPTATGSSKPSDSKPSDSASGSTPSTSGSNGASNMPSTATPTKPSQPSDATPPSSDPGKTPADDPSADFPDLRGKCGISSGYPGDETCISAPSAEEGMQLHVGPKDYKDMADVAQFIMNPGDESSLCWTFHTPNAESIYYQSSVLSGRGGTHHIINTMYDGAALPDAPFARCGDSTKATGSIPGASKSYMPRTHVAPEYADVGRAISAKAAIQSDMHYYNFTDKPIIREYWLNIYYAPKDQIKRDALQIRAMGGFGWNSNPIAPGTDKVFQYKCPPAKGEGYILNLLGHYHAHGKRFGASITRASTGMTEKVFEMYDYQDPATFEYNSVVKNPAFSDSVPGAVSGQLAIHEGDVLNWECHIVNDSDVGLRYVNEVKTGEMCNLWGASLGVSKLDCLSQ